MLKRVFIKIEQIKYQFFRYAITGASGVILDMATLYGLKEFGGMRPVLAVVINQVIVLSYIFLLNKYWSFGAIGESGKQAVKFLLIAFINYAVAVGWMYLFNERLGLNYLLVRLANIALSVTWNFILYRSFVYKKHSNAGCE